MTARLPTNGNGSSYIDEQLLNVFQAEKQQLHKMKEQNKILTSLNQKVLKKDEEIEQLQRVVKKYKRYYQQYDLLKATINQKNKEFERLTQQNKLLFNEMNKMMGENKQLQQKLLQSQKMKHQFIKERNSSDIRFRGIQQTFRQYQQQCRNKQKQLTRELQKSRQQIKQLSNKVDDLQTVKFQNEQLKAKINNNIRMQKSNEGSGQKNNFDYQQNMAPNRNQNASHNPLSYHSQTHSNPRSQINFSKSRQRSPNKSTSQVYDQDSAYQIQRLKRQLINKQMQFQRSKALNHQLSIQFDKSVSKICQFQKQLSVYRKQNHELKKTLSLFVEKQQYEKIHKNRLQRNEQTSQESDQQDQNDEGIGKNSGSHFSDSYR